MKGSEEIGERMHIEESFVDDGTTQIEHVCADKSDKLEQRREALRKELSIIRKNTSRGKPDALDLEEASVSAAEMIQCIVLPCIHLSSQLRGNAPKYATLPIIKDLSKCDLIKWIEDFLLMSIRKRWAPPETKNMLLSFIKNSHYEAIKDLPTSRILKYLIAERYKKTDLAVYKERLKNIREIESPDLEQYIERFACVFSSLEVISATCEDPGMTLEELDLYGQRAFYNGLLAKNKKVLFYMKAQAGPLKDMAEYLIENEKITSREIKEISHLQKIQYHLDLSAKTMFPKKGDLSRQKCVLHPKGNHFENECKLKKKIKQIKKQAFPS